MSHYLGIDIGTFESKGVLVDGEGRIVASASKPHKMLVPRPGWAEHRPRQDWWGDFTFICRKLLAESGVDPKSIRAVGASAIGPCMLPVDATGEALSNAALYGVDARAAAEIDELNAAIGAERILDRCGNALTSQSVGPEDPVAEEKPSRDFCQGRQDRHVDDLSGAEADRRMRHRPLFGGQFFAALCDRKAGLERRACRRTSSGSTACRSCSGRPTSPVM